MEIEYGGYYQKEIYFRAIRWIYQPSKKSWLIRIGVFVIFTILYGATIYLSFQEGKTSSFDSARMARHLITFLALGYLLLQPYISSYRKASQLWKDPLVRRNITGRVSMLGIMIDLMKDWLPWSQFVKVNKTPEAITLLTASGTFVLLPRAFFKEQRDWKMVQDIVETKVQEVIE
jgi:hypothetical protein